jgi:hypothetical protein
MPTALLHYPKEARAELVVWPRVLWTDEDTKTGCRSAHTCVHTCVYARFAWVTMNVCFVYVSDVHITVRVQVCPCESVGVGYVCSNPDWDFQAMGLWARSLHICNLFSSL